MALFGLMKNTGVIIINFFCQFSSEVQHQHLHHATFFLKGSLQNTSFGVMLLTPIHIRSATSGNIEFISNTLNKYFISPVKKNRKVALTLEDKNKGRYVNINSIDMGACSSRLIYLKGCDIPLNIGKQIVKNGNDGEPMYLYLIINDTSLSFSKTLEIYQKRWKIEEYHKSLKQNLKIEHSPTKVETSQRNHINLTVFAFIKLEKLRLNYKMNHFAIKEKIYIEALKVAYEKVMELKYG